jgi:uncharacterized integral membrane protein (TIGR00698 family)
MTAHAERADRANRLLDRAPGILLAVAVAVFGYLAAPQIARLVPVPAMVIALVLGTVIGPLVGGPWQQAGLGFCVRSVLRWSVALLGLRVGLSDVAALGSATALLIVGSMAATIASGFVFARWCGLTPGLGALAGVGTGVCGASATLAVSTVVPDYAGKSTDIAFVVVAVNALATLAMLLYPPLCLILGFNAQQTGIMLGATIHDVAQVAGAGYAISDTVGTTAVVVKLFRVFLLLPVVLTVGLYFARIGRQRTAARVPVPVFAIVFLALCVLNSFVPMASAALPAYSSMKSAAVEASNWGLLVAIAALGLTTPIRAILQLGWRHIVVALGTTTILLIVVTGGLAVLQIG